MAIEINRRYQLQAESHGVLGSGGSPTRHLYSILFMEPNRDFHIVASNQQALHMQTLSKPDPGATPFKTVVDPKLRLDLRRALIDLIDYHDEALAENFSQGKLLLESYKEYIELFARSLKETMESREGVSYLLRSVGFEVRPEEINLNPELRWKKGPGVFGASLL